MKRAWLSVPGLMVFATLVFPPSGGSTDGNRAAPGRRDVLTVDSPGAVRDNTTEPGESDVIPRWSEVAPPMIPHGIADFVPITRSDNACQECHAVDEKVAGEPTPIPQSHYLDLRSSPDTVRDAIAGTRYVCLSCHVVLTDAVAFPGESP